MNSEIMHFISSKTTPEEWARHERMIKAAECARLVGELEQFCQRAAIGFEQSFDAEHRVVLKIGP